MVGWRNRFGELRNGFVVSGSPVGVSGNGFVGLRGECVDPVNGKYG